MEKEILFKNKKHQDDFAMLMKNCDRNDCETQSMMYLLALVCENTNQAKQCFNFEGTSIILKGLNADWQTSSSVKAIRFAYNLWNGYSADSDVYKVFGTSLDKYLIEAIRLRFSI